MPDVIDFADLDPDMPCTAKIGKGFVVLTYIVVYIFPVLWDPLDVCKSKQYQLTPIHDHIQMETVQILHNSTAIVNPLLING